MKQRNVQQDYRNCGKQPETKVSAEHSSAQASNTLRRFW
jgi:hypothetical protein